MAHRHDRFRVFKNDQFDFETRITLGSAYYGAADVGEVLSTAARVEDGDYESWFREWTATGERVRGIAEEAAQAGHHVSAREAYLRSANYLFEATGSLDGTKDPDRLVPTWRAHRDCWEEFCSRWIRRSRRWRSPMRTPSSRASCSSPTAAARRGPR